MPEIEREGILEQRFQDAWNLDQMVKVQKGGEAEPSETPKRTHLVWSIGTPSLTGQ